MPFGVSVAVWVRGARFSVAGQANSRRKRVRSVSAPWAWANARSGACTLAGKKSAVACDAHPSGRPHLRPSIGLEEHQAALLPAWLAMALVCAPVLHDRVEQLIHRIKPATHSESRRTSVAKHVSDLIAECFAPIEVGGHHSRNPQHPPEALSPSEHTPLPPCRSPRPCLARCL